MKKYLSLVLAFAMIASLLAGCGSKNTAADDQTTNNQTTNNQTSNDQAADDQQTAQDDGQSGDAGQRTADPDKQKIVFGITASFVDFTDYIPEMMAQWGYEVELQVLDSPVVANTALAEGSIDVNYIQHLPYLLAYNDPMAPICIPWSPTSCLPWTASLP